MNQIASRWVDLDVSQLFVRGLKGILSLLMGVIFLALSIGVLKTAWDLSLFWMQDLEVAVRRIIIDVLILLAIVEVFRTLLV